MTSNEPLNQPPQSPAPESEPLGPLVVPPRDQFQPRFLSMSSAKDLMGQSFLGPDHFRNVFGKDVGLVPLIPAWITEQLLNERCPIFQDGRLIKDTHVLVLVPRFVDGEDYTPRMLFKLCEKRGAKIFDGPAAWRAHPFADKPLERASWVLMPRRDPPCTQDADRHFRRKSIDEQLKVLKESYPNYRVAHALELLTGVVMYAFSSRKRTLSDCYLRCVETSSLSGRVNVGFFERSGLKISVHDVERSMAMGLSLVRDGKDDDCEAKTEPPIAIS